MKEKVRLWLHNLIATVIAGGANTALAVVGIAAADAAGANVKALDLKQTGVMFISGGVVGLLLYLKQSPLPQEPTTESKPNETHQ